MPRSICKNEEKIALIAGAMSTEKYVKTGDIARDLGYDHQTVLSYLLMLTRRNHVVHKTRHRSMFGKMGKVHYWKLRDA